MVETFSVSLTTLKRWREKGEGGQASAGHLHGTEGCASGDEDSRGFVGALEEYTTPLHATPTVGKRRVRVSRSAMSGP